jgi:hypothetical protein
MDTLTAGGLTLPLVQGPFGPSISPMTDEAKPLSWAVGEIPGLARALERGEEAATGQCRVRRPGEDEDLTEARRRWRELTGEELGEDVVIVDASLIRRRLALPRAALLGIERALQELRDAAPKPAAPWLFTPEPFHADPAPEEEAWIRALEARALAFDRAVHPTDDATAHAAKRRALLFDLDAHGLFTDVSAHQRLAWLEKWQLPTLASYARTAIEMHHYLRSTERRNHFPSATDEAILGAPVSIDWFRSPPASPAGMTPFAWLAYCERMFKFSEPHNGGAGQIFTRFSPEQGPLVLFWRRDDAVHAALYDARLGSS